MSFYLDPAYGRMNWQQPAPFDGSGAKAFANLLLAARKEEPAYSRVNPFSSSAPIVPQPVYTVSGGIQAGV
jgi:hypothetical protein